MKNSPIERYYFKFDAFEVFFIVLMPSKRKFSTLDKRYSYYLEKAPPSRKPLKESISPRSKTSICNFPALSLFSTLLNAVHD